MQRRSTATALLALVACAYCGLFAANSLTRVRTFTADSMNYVDVARRVIAGDGLVQSTGGFNQPFYLSGDLDLPSAFTAQPPGYPLATALLTKLGIRAADAALAVSAVAYATILVLVYLLGRRIGGTGAGAVALGAALLFVPLTHLGRAALSECLAVMVVLLFFLLLDQHLEQATVAMSDESGRRSRVPWLNLLVPLGLGVVAGTAFGVRYALWPLPLVGIAALWLGTGSGSGRSRVPTRPSSLAAFAAGALLPMVWILGRNLAAEGRFLPAAMPAVTMPGESLARAVTALLGGWRSTTVGNGTDSALLLAALGLLAVLGLRARRLASLAGSSAAMESRLPLLTGCWAVLYLAAVVWRSTQANFDPIGARLALPATVPLIPLTGAVIAGALPSARRLAWLPFGVLVLCFGTAFVREATLWSTGRDVRTVEFRSERQQWLRDHTGPGDLVIGGGTMDVPFLFPGRLAISYAGLPYTKVLTYPDLERIADRHCADFDRILLVVRPTVVLGGGRSDEDPSDWLGPFIAAARAGRHEAYPLLEPLAVLTEAWIYQVTCS